jgi:TatA/E family protein of Tat protein translocase
MGSLGGWEIIFIFVLVLVLFGPHRLPELARTLGKARREITKITSEFQSQLTLLGEEEDQPRSNKRTEISTSDAYTPPVEEPALRLDQTRFDQTPVDQSSPYIPADRDESDDYPEDTPQYLSTSLSSPNPASSTYDDRLCERTNDSNDTRP